MSKVAMSEAVARVTVGNPVRYEHICCWSLDVGTHDLITTAQAEAYKDACVREALEEAQAACFRREIRGTSQQAKAAFRLCAKDIGDLIAKASGESK
uniref:hypothetical protein n=1 Tax=Castellaniella defragrans TaxID=75697 RepID=UPI003340CBE1